LSVKDETIAKLEQEVVALKDCVLKVAKEGFNQAVKQAILLYGVLADGNKFDVQKEVYQDQLISIEDILGEGTSKADEEGRLGGGNEEETLEEEDEEDGEDEEETLEEGRRERGTHLGPITNLS